MQRAGFLFLWAGLSACASSASSASSAPSAPSTNHASSTRVDAPSVLVRCGVELQRSGESEPIPVAGWGSDEAEARENAALMAGHLAERLDRTSAWLLLLAASPSAAWLHDGFATQPYEGEAPAGWRIRESSCEQESIEVSGRVSAVWSESPIPYESSSAAAAIEGARRVSCGVQWADEFVEVFAAMAHMGPEDRAAMPERVRAEVGARAIGCVSAGSHRLDPARHPATPDEAGESMCQVTLAPSRDARFVGQAVGASRPMAVHRASLRAVQVAFASTDRRVVEATGSADPSERATRAAQAISSGINADRFAALTGTEFARCASIDSDAASWGSGSCGAATQAPANRLCSKRRESMAAMAREALASLESDDGQRVVMGAWGEVQGCTADCLAGFQVASASDFRDTHAAHCGSEASARATLQRGVEARQAAAVFHCLSPDFAAMIFEGFAERPERVWEGLQSLLADDSRLSVQSSGGAFRIVFAQR